MTYLVIAIWNSYEKSVYECADIRDLREAFEPDGRLNYLLSSPCDLTIAKVFRSGEASIKKWLKSVPTKTRISGICSIGKRCKECGSTIKPREDVHFHKDLCAKCSRKYK